jgi:hypothetical protein
MLYCRRNNPYNPTSKKFPFFAFRLAREMK